MAGCRKGLLCLVVGPEHGCVDICKLVWPEVRIYPKILDVDKVAEE